MNANKTWPSVIIALIVTILMVLTSVFANLVFMEMAIIAHHVSVLI